MKAVKGYPLLIGYLGIFIMFTGLFMLLPTLVFIFVPYDTIHWWKFVIPGLISFVIGLLLSLCIKGKHIEQLKRFEDAIFLVLMWIVTILISSIPFILNGFSFVSSLFEVTSSISTTGLSNFELSELPAVFIFYRSILMFFGGIGLVLVITSTVSDRYGMRLYQAEGHQDKLMSNLTKSARLIMVIYLSYIIVGTIAYMAFGMDFFDAINYSISSVATGGFSTKDGSIGEYRLILSDARALGIEITTIILMLLGGTSFVIHAYLFRGQIKKAFRHNEFILLVFLLLIFVPLMYTSLKNMPFYNEKYALRDSIFMFVSSLTTTGLTTVNAINTLPSLFVGLLIVIMLFGGQSGSTSGALKQGRISLALKSTFWYFRDKMGHRRTIRTNFILRNGTFEVVSDVEIRHNYAFIFTYLIIIMTGSFIYMGYGYNFEDSIFEITSLLGNGGLSVGIIHDNAPLGVLWTGIVAMFVGRLEFTVIIVALMKIFLDIRRKEVL